MMSDMSLDTVLIPVALGLLVAFNGLCVVLVLLQLPGSWLMLLATALAAWWGDWQVIGPWTLAGLGAMALAGEGVELLAGTAGAAKAGGSKRGALLAIIGAIVGAIVGVAVPPIVIGSILGACVGAALGSIAGDRWAGRSWRQATDAGKGAAKGRLLGTIGKVAIAAAMWLVVTLAVMI